MRPFHPAYIIYVLPKLLSALWVTLAMVAGTLFFGGLLGFLLVAGKIRSGKIAKTISNVYIYTVRCVPSIVMLFIVYYGLPELLLTFGVDINRVGKGFFVIVTFSVLFAANIAEVFRTAYEAVDRGQREAALSIGLSERQAFRRIILPQCVVVAIPNFTNALISLMKEGALAYTIGLIDIMGKGQLLIGKNQGSYGLEIYLALAGIYWVITILTEKFSARAEITLSRGRKAPNAGSGERRRKKCS